MKKTITILLLLSAVLMIPGCSQYRNESIFTASPDTFVEYVNYSLGMTDSEVSFSTDSFTEKSSYYSTKIRTYTSDGFSLQLLLTKDEEKIESVRLMVNDQDLFDTSKNGAQTIIEFCNKSIKDHTLNNLIGSYQKYRDLKIKKSETIGDFTYSFEWIGDNYTFTITPGSEDHRAWYSEAKNDVLSYSVPGDWKVYLKYDIGIAYETPSGLIISVDCLKLSLPMIELEYELKLSFSSASSQKKYLSKYFDTIVKTASKESGIKIDSKSYVENTFLGVSVGDGTYKKVSKENEAVVFDTRQVSFIYNKQQINIMVSKNGPFVQKDIIEFQDFLDSFAFIQ